MRFILHGLYFLSLGLTALSDERQERKVIGTQVREGIEVELAVEPVEHGKALNLQTGETIRFLFSIRDTTTGEAVSGLYPAAWLQTRPKTVQHAPNYRKMVQTFISGGLFSKPDIDLNVYHVLALNDNNTISVVDPLFGFGGSKLLTMISLPGPGKDWVKMTRASKLFVSLPETNQIALIDTSSWTISTIMPQVNNPTHLVLQPDEHFLWASLPDGIAVFKTAPFSMQYLFPTGKGEHQITFSSDNRFAFVTNYDDATLAVIDLSDFKITKIIPIEKSPSSIAYDAKAEVVYITHSETGTITCVDANEHEIYKTIPSDPGLSQIRFSPRGRWGFIVNPKTNQLFILDSSLDSIVQTATVEEEPYEITFSDNFAYIRHRKNPKLILIPLDSETLGKKGELISTVEAPGGDAAYGTIQSPTPSSSIVQAPGANAVLIANPTDKSIYFYKEGMAAPMGQFDNYGCQPRAVLVVDRSLREKSRPGVYETVGRLEKAGIADVAFFTDSPRMTLGFEIPISEPTAGPSSQTLVTVEPIPLEKKLFKGKPVELKFQISGDLIPPSTELFIHTYMSSGSWQNRQRAEISKNGIASVTVTPPTTGIYQVALNSHDNHFKIRQKNKFLFHVTK